LGPFCGSFGLSGIVASVGMIEISISVRKGHFGAFCEYAAK
jgi:hypothetical protein